MRHHGKLLGVFDIAGIVCGIECQEEAFWDLLASRYSDFASDAAPQLSLTVEVTEPPPEEVRAHWSGPFARIGGSNGLLSIEGVDFSGAFDERSGRGWIAQPLDPSPIEAFLTAICAGRLLREGGFFLHAAAIVEPTGAYVFFGPSGSGKTTVAELAREGVISDEIIAIRREGNRYRVSGVPWRGRRLTAPLAGLFLLRKARETMFTALTAVETVRHLLPSVLFPRPDSPEVGRFLEIAGELVRTVPGFEMRFTPDRSCLDTMPRRGQGGA